MNLTDVLKEACLIDHSWWGKGMLKPGEPTFDAEAEGIRKRNNIKPELEVEWGMAGPTIDLNEPAGKVQRSIPEDALGDAEAVIFFARDQMNRGSDAEDIVRQLKAKYDKTTLGKAVDGLKKQFALDGIVGCIAVDGRGYKDCQEALKVSSHSPYKRYIKYVIGCRCGDPHRIHADENALFSHASSTGKPIDDFLSASKVHKPKLVSHCRSTMLPILSFRGDLDPSEVDQTLVEVLNLTNLPEGQIDELWEDKKNEKYANNLEVLRAGFRLVRANVKKMADSQLPQPNFPSDVRMGVADSPVDIMAPPIPDMSPDIGLETTPMITDTDVVQSLEIDMDQFQEPEFEGTDEVFLDDAVSPKGPLDVDMRQDMEIE